LRAPAATSKFEKVVLEHLDAAYNLARWLTSNEQDAQDVVQESCMKAFRAFDTLRSVDVRPWFLTIVRNTSFTWLQRRKTPLGIAAGQDEELTDQIAADTSQYDPHLIAIRSANVDAVHRAIEQLPPVLREAVVLREMEGLSYREIAQIAGVPMGTVMSRLARGRAQLQSLLSDPTSPGTVPTSAREAL
jgi:RNA polymerase sigma-70 factor (ECF subfamily)